MEQENKNIFTMTNEKGEKVECEVVLTIDSDEYKKSYIVYTDHTLDEFGNIRTYASIYDPTGESLELKPVTTDEEWDMIESVLASAQKQVLKDEINNTETESEEN